MTNNINKNVQVFDYVDYRKYLSEYYKRRRSVDKGFTQTFICKQIGLPNTRSYFFDIVKGIRNISNIKIDLFIKLLELDKAEAQYFRMLVQYNQTSIASEKEFYLDQLISLNRTPKKFIDKKSFAYFKDWYHSTIRAMLDVYDVSDNYGEISKKMLPDALSAKKVEDSIALLKKLKLIKKNKEGYWKPTNKILSSDENFKDEMIKTYQIQCLELAKSALIHNIKNLDVSTKTISISNKGYQKIQAKIEKFKSEISSIIHKDENKPENVIQINIQMFSQCK